MSPALLSRLAVEVAEQDAREFLSLVNADRLLLSTATVGREGLERQLAQDIVIASKAVARLMWARAKHGGGR